jgi:hypothetical protein
MRKLILIGAIIIGLSGCESEKQDAKHIERNKVDRSAPDHVTAFPDTFPNVATKCAGFGHNRLWVTSHVKDDTQPVITKDEECP